MAPIRWHEIPFVRICIPFIMGILVQQTMDNSAPLIAGLLFIAALTLFAFVLKTGVYKQQLRTGIMLALLFSCGAFVRKSAEPSAHEIQQLASFDGVASSIVLSAENTDYGHKATMKLINPATQEGDIKFITYTRASAISLLPGDTLVFQGGLQTFSSPSNPYAFDASKYYRRQGIHLRRYIDDTDVIAHHTYKGRINVLRKSAEIREEVSKIYKTYVSNEQSCAVLLAMTIGITDGLDDNIYDAYAKSGAIHVLSISGLHVGIVSGLLFLLIGRVRSTDKLHFKILKAAMLVGGIWAFAFIAGMSPSITRAAFMSSVYFVGATIGRPVKGLNVLAFTAFACLCVDPFQINSLSFQFSYLALCGILVFYKPVYNMFSIRSYVGKFIWGTMVMSIAAQIFLIPLLIHYFNQISIISLLSSLVAIPASYGILIGGILLLPLHYITPVVAEIAGQGIDIGINFVNHMIIAMSELPFSYLSDVYVPGVEVAILAITTLLVALRVLTQRKQWTYTALCGICIFGAMHVLTLQQTSRQEMLAIYPFEDRVAIDFISERNCFTTFNIDSMSTYRRKEVASFRNTSRARESHMTLSIPVLQNHAHVLELPGQGSDHSCYRLAVLTDSEYRLLNADLLALQADWIILSSGLSYVMRKAAKDFCTLHHIQFHDLREHGTFYLAKHKNNDSNESQWQTISG